ncbi:MAG: type IV pilus twitching motility protein PilT [Clostridia bacterium]
MNLVLNSLKEMINNNASDLHIEIGMPPIYRVNGNIISITKQKVSENMVNEVVKKITNDHEYEKLRKKGEVDFAFSIPNIARFRANVFRTQGKLGCSFRIIPNNVPSFASLNMPKELLKLADNESGLVILTGPTGSGKSTTLAALINHINENFSKHIITLEDPIEFIHSNKKSLIRQREVGKDTISFASGLKASLREDPDVILIGEMRDAETTDIALKAAETGHLVFATMHTPGVVESIDRILGIFEPHQRKQVAVQLAISLKGSVFQKLLPKVDQGRIPAIELLIVNSAVRNLIREEKTFQLNSVMQTSAEQGMLTMDNSIKKLYESNLISESTYKRMIPTKG